MSGVAGAADFDTAWKRLNARGSARVHMRCDRVIVVNWWPPGQQGNPFCQKSWSGRVLSEVVIRAERETRPPARSIEDALWYRKQDEAAKRRFRDRVNVLAGAGIPAGGQPE